MALRKDIQDALNRKTISASVSGANISFTSHVWRPVHAGNDVLFCQGASLIHSGTTGVLAVHLIDDPVNTWYLLNLTAGADPVHVSFDLVGDSNYGTTVTVDAKLFVYPCYYKTASNFQNVSNS